jgi:hypothetical protein
MLHVEGFTFVSKRRVAGNHSMRERSVVKLYVNPPTKYSCSGSPPRSAKGKTTMGKRGGPKGRKRLPETLRRRAVAQELGIVAHQRRARTHQRGDAIERGEADAKSQFE